MNSRNTAIAAVVAAVIVVVAGVSYVLYSGEEDDGYVGSPWLNGNLDGNTPSDRPSAKDDFYTWANHDWMLKTDLDGRDILTWADLRGEQVKAELLETVSAGFPGTEGEMVKAVYDQVTDAAARNAAGSDPLAPYLEPLIDCTDLGQAFLATVPGYHWSITYTPNADDWALMAYVTPTTLVRDVQFFTDSNRDALEEWAGDILVLAGFDEDDARTIASDAIEVEYGLIDNMDGTAVGPTLEILADFAYPIRDILSATGIGDDTQIYMTDYGYLQGLEYYAESEPEKLVNSQILRSVVYSSTMLGEDMWDMYWRMAGPEPYAFASEDQAYAVLGSEAFKIMLSGVYCDGCVDPALREEVRTLTNDMIEYYKGLITDCDWVSDETRKGAMSKLDLMGVNVAEFEWGRDYTGVSIGSGSTLLDNHVSGLAHYRGEVGPGCGQHYDNDKMMMDYTLIVNAFYSPAFNSVNIDAAFIGPLDDLGEYGPEEVMAYVGFVIGHEISHSFDTTGSLYDAHGEKVDWWAPEDREVYDQRAHALMDYYGTMEPLPGWYVDPEQVKNEALADLCGMTCVMAVAAGYDSFDYAGFFETLAKSWCGKEDLAGVEDKLETDMHPPMYLRINLNVQQFQQFHDAFGVTEGDGMWLDPSDRVRVW